MYAVKSTCMKIIDIKVHFLFLSSILTTCTRVSYLNIFVNRYKSNGVTNVIT